MRQLNLPVMVLGLVLIIKVPLIAQDRTVREFKEYISGKLPDLDSDMADRIATQVDRDNDGKVSSVEFSNRMKVVQRVLAARSGLAPPSRSNVARPGAVTLIAPMTGSDDATVLLITADEIAQDWVPFARWKTANGKLTKIVTIGQIRKQYRAANVHEQIRLCVRDHIENHKTKWVVLGGDSLPGGTGLVPGGHQTVHRQEPKGIPTDIVYLSKTSWDADGDGAIGEWRDDREAISYPDGRVGLGRIPVRTSADVAAFTAKVVAYESQYPTDKFATRMIYTCTDRPAYAKVRNSWDGYVSNSWAGTVGRFFSAETPWDEQGSPGSYALSAENLVKLFNDKSTGKLHIHGHGHLPAWVLERSTFTKSHAAQLKNGGAYPLITTVSCNTGEYDSADDPSIVERILRVPNAGSVAVVAPIRTGKPHFADPRDFRRMVVEGKLDGTTLTMTRYWVNGLGKGASTGHAIMQAKAEMAADARKSPAYHLCICELNLLGDPTLDMRATAPRTALVKVKQESDDVRTRVTVTTDAPGATVCVWDGGKVYRVATADKQGQVVVTVPAQEATASVTVSGPGLNAVRTMVSLSPQ